MRFKSAARSAIMGGALGVLVAAASVSVQVNAASSGPVTATASASGGCMDTQVVVAPTDDPDVVRLATPRGSEGTCRGVGAAGNVRFVTVKGEVFLGDRTCVEAPVTIVGRLSWLDGDKKLIGKSDFIKAAVVTITDPDGLVLSAGETTITGGLFADGAGSAEASQVGGVRVTCLAEPLEGDVHLTAAGSGVDPT